MSLFGLGSKSSNTHGWIDPKTSAAQWGNLEGAKGLPQSYTPTSADQIGGYFNSYINEAVNRTLGSLDQDRQRAQIGAADLAKKRGSWGGTGTDVSAALIDHDYGDRAANTAANMFASGWGQAADMASQENMRGYAYPLQRQGAVDHALGMVTPETFGKRTDKDPAAAFSNFGKALGIGGDIAKFFASMG